MDSKNYLNFDSDQQMLPNVVFDQEEFNNMLKRFDEELQKLEEPTQSLQGTTFNTQLQNLEDPTQLLQGTTEPAQPLQGTTEVKTNKRKRQRPSKIIQAEGSIQKTAQQKANTQNVNKCIDLCKPTLAAVPENGIIDTKGLLNVGKITLNEKVGEVPSFEWFDDEIKSEDIDLDCTTTSAKKHNISCDVEWVREDKFLKQLLGIVYKYKGVGGFARTKLLKKKYLWEHNQAIKEYAHVDFLDVETQSSKSS
ncbi:uncharacterized protein [Bactrocera oleae]|uniref:uncharacterized protein n=1 Tax=Bactrocera oleae TaxID=104688 RepID=UPI00387EDD9D